MNTVITLVVDTLEQEVEPALADAINKLHSLGHTVKEVRVTNDSGETKIPTNQIAGVTVPEPVEQNITPAEPPADVPASTEPPVDVPVDPTSTPEPVPESSMESTADPSVVPTDTPPAQ